MEQFSCNNIYTLHDASCLFNTVFNLTHGIEVESTRKMIDQYKKDNKDQIKKNLSKMVSIILYTE